jgi:poly-gamma-glutamate synthase PgsB/CapB
VTDYGLFVIALGSLFAAVLWLAFAATRHRASLTKVPLRIHVAGTRGKSTTTRFIAAGLRAAGMRVVAKTTGSEARLIRPDGGEEEWTRWGNASIREQIRLVRYAGRMGADALVVECMAIHPEMVWASERHMVQATTAVLTNARPDHFEDVGTDPGAMADALRWVTPRRGRLVVAEEAATPALRTFAAARGSELIAVETSGLGPMEEDRELALAVCAAHGVPREVAAPAMALTAGDPGIFFERTLFVGGKSVRFANAFACNDVDSFAQAWAEVQAPPPPVVLLNARPDRPVRSRRFVEFIAAQRPAPVLFVTGDPYAFHFARRAASGVVRRLKTGVPGAALAELAAAAPPGGVIWGVGNYHGFGAAMIGALREHDPAC